MIGRNILHYQIVERLGAGGMGEIYKAQDTRLNRLVAIKVLTGANSGDPDSRRRFIQEAQAASTLNHPNIITIYDILSEDDLQFMVMEYVNGRTLSDVLLNDGPISTTATLQYTLQITDALGAAHAAGIIHRDLKPGNIMVTPRGHVKILDFGLAKLTAPAGPVSLSDVTATAIPVPMTQQGAIVGTVSYMSPEQAQATRVDARSDIFSLGSVLYELLTASKAFQGETPLFILTAILRDEPRPISELSPTVPARLVEIIHRALRKDPAQRWQSMQEMHDELSVLKQRLDSGIQPAPELPAFAPPTGRSPLPVPLLIIVALAAVLGGFWWWTAHNASRPSGPRPSPVVQAPSAQAAKPSALSPPILDNNAVLEMVQAKVAPDVIIGHIRSSQTRFSLTTSEVIRLAKGGVGEPILQAMRDPMGVKAPVSPSGAPDVPSTGLQPKTVQIVGGERFPITLAEDVPADCEPGQVLHFRAAADVSSSGAIVIPKGAPVTGVVVEAAHRKFLVHTTRPTFRLIDVTAVDGSKLKIRATSGRLGESRKDPPLEPSGGLKSKDALAPAGSRFTAYFDGDQTLSIRASSYSQ